MTAVPSSDPVVVLSRSFSRHPVLRQELVARYPATRFNETGRTLAGDEIIAFMQGATKAIVALERIDAALMDALPALRVISKYGVGLDNVDLQAASRRGLLVGWTGGVNALSVAELAVCLMLDCLRGVMRSNLEVRAGTWRQSGGGLLRGRTVGLLGCGHVGRAIAPLLVPFGCQVIAHDIQGVPEVMRSLGVMEVDFDALVSQSDVLSIHVPLTRRTHHLFDAATLARMPAGAVLVNTARGGIVDEAALAGSLVRGHLFAAALDVFEAEPPGVTDLIALPNLVSTPHIGGSSAEAVLAMGRAAIAGLDGAIEPLRHVPIWED